MPSFSDSAAFFRSSFSPRTRREPDGSPLRIKSASSAKFLTERPSIFLPPRTLAITAEVILASWLLILRQMAYECKQRLRRGNPRPHCLRALYFPDSIEFHDIRLD